MQFLYARVSTSDQTATHQLQQARAAGFDIDTDNVIKDEGVSGISTCFAERDGGRRLLDKLRAGDELVVRWLDRLGRNYDDVRDFCDDDAIHGQPFTSAQHVVKTMRHLKQYGANVWSIKRALTDLFGEMIPKQVH